MLQPGVRDDPSPASRVTALVVSFNSGHCLAALGAGLQGLAQVIVVDNASNDDTLAQAARHLPQARLLAQTRNLGFGAANNLGWRAAETEFVLLINPDCLCSAEAIAQLVRTADAHPNASVVAPQLLGRRGDLDISYRWRADGWASRGPGADGPCCVGFVSGAVMLIRRAALQRVDGFDESFFLYYEDEDLCLRLLDQFGPILVDPASEVQHLSRSSVAGPHRLQAEFIRGFHHIQSKFLFRRKHLGRQTGVAQRWRYGLTALAESLLRIILLDARRAARCIGRVAGAIGYADPGRKQGPKQGLPMSKKE